MSPFINYVIDLIRAKIGRDEADARNPSTILRNLVKRPRRWRAKAA